MTESLYQHIVDIKEGQSIPDYFLLKQFSNSISKDSSSLDDHYIQLTLPLLNDVLVNEPEKDQGNVLFDLFVIILRKLPFADVQTIYSQDRIFELIKSPRYSVRALVLQILSNKADDPLVIKFLQESDFLYVVTKQHFSIPQISDEDDLNASFVTSVASSYENLIKALPEKVCMILREQKFINLYQIARSSQNSILITRLMDFICMVIPQLQDFLPKSIYSYTRSDFMTRNDDPLTVMLMIEFYAKLVTLPINEAFVDNISASLYDLIYMFSIRQQDITIHSYFSSQLVNLLCVWSYSNNPKLINLLENLLEKFQIFKSFNLYFESDDEDIRLLSKFNANKINNIDLIEELRQTPLFKAKYLPILLNIISREEYFKQLIDTKIVTTSKIIGLSHDMLFAILATITKYKHSTTWLLQTQHQLMSEYVLGSPRLITESEIWSLKRETLENLLWRNSNEDLSPWFDSIKKTYSLMINGRNVKDICSVAAVADSTA